MTSRSELKEKLQSEILETPWEPVTAHFARGVVYLLENDLNIDEVGLAMAEDDVAQMKKWIDHGLLYPPTPEQATQFADDKERLFSMLIIEPYVLIQEK